MHIVNEIVATQSRPHRHTNAMHFTAFENDIEEVNTNNWQSFSANERLAHVTNTYFSKYIKKKCRQNKSKIKQKATTMGLHEKYGARRKKAMHTNKQYETNNLRTKEFI